MGVVVPEKEIVAPVAVQVADRHEVPGLRQVDTELATRPVPFSMS